MKEESDDLEKNLFVSPDPGAAEHLNPTDVSDQHSKLEWEDEVQFSISPPGELQHNNCPLDAERDSGADLRSVDMSFTPAMCGVFKNPLYAVLWTCNQLVGFTLDQHQTSR